MRSFVQVHSSKQQSRTLELLMPVLLAAAAASHSLSRDMITGASALGRGTGSPYVLITLYESTAFICRTELLKHRVPILRVCRLTGAGLGAFLCRSDLEEHAPGQGSKASGRARGPAAPEPRTAFLCGSTAAWQRSGCLAGKRCEAWRCRMCGV